MKPLIVANWKANKTIQETVSFVSIIKNELENQENVEIVLCPSFTSLPAISQLLQGSKIKVGAQTVSHFNPGAFTGEVVSEMLNGLVSHCIVGHSERRKYFGETEEQVGSKIEKLIAQNIVPVLCISDIGQLDNYLKAHRSFRENIKKIIFVYEPPSAISGGGDYHPESPQEASKNVTKINEALGEKVPTLYGGSVSDNDVDQFLKEENIKGVLVGKASLDPETFVSLVKKASGTVV